MNKRESGRDWGRGGGKVRQIKGEAKFVSFYDSWHSLDGVFYLARARVCVCVCERMRERGRGRCTYSTRAWLALCSMFHCRGSERERGNERERERESMGENERERDEGGRSAGSALCQRGRRRRREEEERRKEVRGVHSICWYVWDEWEERAVRQKRSD